MRVCDDPASRTSGHESGDRLARSLPMVEPVAPHAVQGVRGRGYLPVDRAGG
jgi:hypothetical protein